MGILYKMMTHELGQLSPLDRSRTDAHPPRDWKEPHEQGRPKGFGHPRQEPQPRHCHFSLCRHQGIFNTAQNVGPPPQQPHEPGARQGRSPFSELNQQLVNMGFPRWNFGNQVVEPVMSIVLLLLIMMLGVRGLLLVGLIYVISHLSQR